MSKSLVIQLGDRKTVVITARSVIYREQIPGDGVFVKLERFAEDGVLTYAMPSLPAGGVVQAFMNGLELGTSVSGVNATLQGYTPGEIAATDQLRFFYTE